MPSDFSKIGAALKKRQAKRRKELKKATKGFKEAKSSSTGDKTVTEGKGLKKASTSKKRDLTKEKAKTFSVKGEKQSEGVIFRGLSKAERLKVAAEAIRRKKAKGAKNVKARLKKSK